MSELLITGANGFLGRSLSEKFQALGHRVHCVGHEFGDIADEQTWDKMPQCEILIHLAGSTFVPLSWKRPAEFLQTNVVGVQRAINWCIKNKSKMIFPSTYIYGQAKISRVSETTKPRPENPYTFSKQLAEQCCRFASKYKGLDVTVLRLFNIYGKGQSEPFLIPHIVNQLDKNEIKVNDLVPRRDFLHIDDAVQAFVHGIGKINGYEVFNIGSGESWSVKQLIEIVQDCAGTKIPVVSGNVVRSNEILDVVADNSKAKDLLGWAPRKSLIIGIQELVDEFYNGKNSK